MTGAAVAGMLVATTASLLAVRWVARHQDTLPREWRGGGRGGHGRTSAAHPSHPSVCPSLPRAARPALPHVSAQRPLPRHRCTPGPVTPLRCAPPGPVPAPRSPSTHRRRLKQLQTARREQHRAMRLPPAQQQVRAPTGRAGAPAPIRCHPGGSPTPCRAAVSTAGRHRRATG